MLSNKPVKLLLLINEVRKQSSLPQRWKKYSDV